LHSTRHIAALAQQDVAEEVLGMYGLPPLICKVFAILQKQILLMEWIDFLRIDTTVIQSENILMAAILDVFFLIMLTNVQSIPPGPFSAAIFHSGSTLREI